MPSAPQASPVSSASPSSIIISSCGRLGIAVRMVWVELLAEAGSAAPEGAARAVVGRPQRTHEAVPTPVALFVVVEVDDGAARLLGGDGHDEIVVSEEGPVRF